MADQVQQAGGGEQIPIAAPPAAVVTPAAAPLETASPTVEKLPEPEVVKKEEPVSKLNGEETKVEAVQVSANNTETIISTPVINPEPESPPQIVEEAKQEVAVQEPQQNDEVKQNNESEVKKDLSEPPTTESNDKVEQSNEVPKDAGDWQKRESDLLKKIEELEKVKNIRSEDGLKLELKLREEEIDLLKARVKNLETELQAALSKPGGKNQEIIENIKQQHEELLSKARGMIFDKTKMVKNQELQIEALTTQVQSLKDINVITKDLLEIRNSEVKAMEERFQAMEARFKAEKERYDLVLKRAQTSTNINDDLRKEYETQLAIFKELREKYEQRVQALVAENNRLKEAVKGPGTSG